MSSHNAYPDYDENVEHGSDIAFTLLGPPHIDPKTGQFNVGHESRVEVARAALQHHLGLSPQETTDSITYAEELARDSVAQIQAAALEEQQAFREQLGV